MARILTPDASAMDAGPSTLWSPWTHSWRSWANGKTARPDALAKVFVTGGAGFIGSHLVDILVGQGYQATAYDNLSNGRREFIEHHLGGPNSGSSRATSSTRTGWPRRWKGTTWSGTWRPIRTSSAAWSSRDATFATA